jgi:hypothetical protein
MTPVAKISAILVFLSLMANEFLILTGFKSALKGL